MWPTVTLIEQNRTNLQLNSEKRKIRLMQKNYTLVACHNTVKVPVGCQMEHTAKTLLYYYLMQKFFFSIVYIVHPPK